MPTKTAPTRAASAKNGARKPLKVRREAVAVAHALDAAKRDDAIGRLFKFAKPAPGVVGEGSSPIIAMDDSLDWAGDMLSGVSAFALAASMIAEGQIFLGFPMLSELAQRPEFRSISEIFATEMTRKWIRFKGKGDEDKGEQIKQLNEAFEQFKIREKFREIGLHEGLFGRAHLVIKVGDPTPAEKETTIGNGWNKATKNKVKKGSITGFKVVEPIWTYPATYNTTDPTEDDFYQPDSWWIMGRKYHKSRILTFVGRDVPDILKGAYAFCGLSRSQMARPYVENWLRTRQSTADIVNAFSVMVLKTNMDAFLEGGSSDGVISRIDFFNANRSNKGTMVVDKDTEDFGNVSAPLGTLDKLQAQALEQICSVSHIPLVKFTGISPTGLNQSNEGEIRIFYDFVLSEQEAIFKDNLNAVVGMVMHHLWGQADPGIEFEFVPLWEMNEKERADLRKTEADTDQVLCDLGAISPEEIRRRVANDPDTPYAGLDPDDMPEPPMDPSMDPSMGEGIVEGDPDALAQRESMPQLASPRQNDELGRDQPAPAAARPAARKPPTKVNMAAREGDDEDDAPDRDLATGPW